MTFYPQIGDVILFDHPSTWTERAIEFGERLADEEPKGTHYYYHSAIAVNPYQMLEAINHISISNIDLSHAVVIRPLYKDQLKLHTALSWGRERVGHLYGYFGLADQILRKASLNHLHLPRKWVEWADNIWPYCSVLVSGVLFHAGIKVRLWPPPDPTQLGVNLEKYDIVYDWRKNA